MLKSYKYRLYPKPDQARMIDQTIGVCRLIYNLGLQIRIEAWKSAQLNISAYELGKQLSELRKEYAFIADVNSQALHRTLNNLDIAYKNFFSGSGLPKFKSKKDRRQSFQCHNNRRRIDWEKSTLSIPKICDIPIVLSRRFDGKIKTVTISKTRQGKYFVSILVDDSKAAPHKPVCDPIKTIGIDLGIKTFAVVSDGRTFEAGRFLKHSLKRLKCLQRRANKKKKGSNKRKKANKKAALLFEKITNRRVDHCHKITTGLIRDNQVDTFVIEDLAVVNMLKNRKLSQAISDSSWGEFVHQMKYKCEWYGKNLIVIDRFAPSSKRCSECGQINDELTLSDREWICQCGAHHDRDLNAAKNIKIFGLNSGAGSADEPVESWRIRRAKKREGYNQIHAK